MNAKTDGWESYTDRTGRRHWRWPAESQTGAAHPLADAGPRQYVGTPHQQQAQQDAPMRLKGK